MPKRSLLGALAISLGVSMSSAAAYAANDVSLRLNWLLLGFHAPIYLGIEKGYFTDRDINLTVHEGRGSGVAAQVVGAGDDDFGIADAGTTILSASKGIPIISVMSPMSKSPFGIISRADAGINTPQDLEGKQLAVSPGDALTQVFPAVVEANGLDESAIELVFVDPAAKVVAVLEKKSGRFAWWYRYPELPVGRTWCRSQRNAVCRYRREYGWFDCYHPRRHGR